MARLLLNLLGSFQAFLDGKPITAFELDRVRALLAYIAMEAAQERNRARVLDATIAELVTELGVL